jgi:uncharacterized protein
MRFAGNAAMAADDLSAPLGGPRKAKRTPIRVPAGPILAGVLALFFGVFVLWASVVDNPFGGEPAAVAPIHVQSTPAKTSAATNHAHGAAAGPAGSGRNDDPAPAQATAGPGKQPTPPDTATINIINGMTGARQEVTIPAGTAASPAARTIDQKFVEMTPEGPIPKIAADGARPADAFAQPVKAIPGKADAPRVALIISGLGVSAKMTAEAIAKLPGAVTLAFVPYGNDAGWVARARAGGHEVLLQVPMEPFDYPENDSGPETLLTSLAPQQNMERLYWLMSRFQGYVGLVDMMGARFTASEDAFAPVLRETAKRGLIFVDDGANPRSVAARIAGANNLPFAKTDVTVDSVPTPNEIDQALERLEMTAREHRLAVGMASALPVSISQIAKWTKSAASRGVLLVPITAVALKDKQS